ncbi:PREDICTED: uncharacterized protein LOC109227724 [Nicotiana attenuata]|uniref:uncharacterized protein LOC109227724 n=1 Tax=Nicotiana attenuata TaxID=49451 RepID=UPI0009058E84|nr:PREDICTED: uncharacterized protein LOC109227724 [Nicotiana attenuata]
MHKQNNDLDDALRLRVFKYSLAGDARKWLQNLPPNSIHSWPELVRAFLAKWFPQSKKSELRDKIFFFKQLPGEHLHEAWDRFKLYLGRSPNHGFPDSILLDKFYMGLDAMNQSIAKNVADGSFMDKTFARITQILHKIAQHNQAWHSEDTTGGIAYGSPSLTNMIRENQERDQVIAGLATNVNVLTKMFTESQTKKVNVVEDLQPISNEDFEEANYVNNSQGGYQRQQYQGQVQQNQWRPNPQGQGNQQWRNDRGSSSDSKLESMLEWVLQNQERSDISIRNMTELVGSHTTSIQKLEMQMRDLSREQNPKQKGTLPSDTIANPKGSGSGPTSHIMAITTRSGKVLQGESEQVVEVEESEQEVEVEEPKVVEIEKVPEELKFQEMNQEEVKEKLSVNIQFVEAFQEMSGFAKYLKDLISKKRTTKNKVVNVTHRVSSIIKTTTVQKKEDSGLSPFHVLLGHVILQELFVIMGLALT